MAAVDRACTAISRLIARTGRATRRLARDEKGASALEFAFVGGMLTLLIGGILEVGLILFVDSALEGGVRDASRFGITGFAPTSVSRETQIVNIINSRLMGLYTITGNDVTERVYANFSDVGQPEPYVDTNGNGQYDLGEPYTDVNGNGQWDADMASSGAGGPGQVVVYEVAINWHPLTPLLLPFLGTDGTLRLTAGLAVRNEPYGS